jgi:hypothetical protein
MSSRKRRTVDVPRSVIQVFRDTLDVSRGLTPEQLRLKAELVADELRRAEQTVEVKRAEFMALNYLLA